ncbi:hypothetical protein [Thermobifida halotolerans]|nr:hypothetical protein [Thermobifida halotolerans]
MFFPGPVHGAAVAAGGTGLPRKPRTTGVRRRGRRRTAPARGL